MFAEITRMGHMCFRLYILARAFVASARSFASACPFCGHMISARTCCCARVLVHTRFPRVWFLHACTFLRACRSARTCKRGRQTHTQKTDKHFACVFLQSLTTRALRSHACIVFCACAFVASVIFFDRLTMSANSLRGTLHV